MDGAGSRKGSKEKTKGRKEAFGMSPGSHVMAVLSIQKTMHTDTRLSFHGAIKC